MENKQNFILFRQLNFFKLHSKPRGGCQGRGRFNPGYQNKQNNYAGNNVTAALLVQTLLQLQSQPGLSGTRNLSCTNVTAQKLMSKCNVQGEPIKLGELYKLKKCMK